MTGRSVSRSRRAACSIRRELICWVNVLPKLSRKKVLKYCTIVPMSGFLGNPIAEGSYNEVGVLYTSIFLIPMRIVM